MTLKQYVIRKTDKELLEELKGLNDIIDTVECFGSRDVILREFIEQELNRREKFEEGL